MKSRVPGFIFILIALITISTYTAAARPTVALVLGGGAARGFSHIGIIQALEENGIPIDMLVGTSMGSIVAGLYASGYSTQNMSQIMASINSAALFEIPFPPRGGLLTTDKLEVFLSKLTQGKSFADLPHPFYSVISELRTGNEVALHEGPVSLGIQASMSIPGLFPPVKINNTYYIDGGMKNAVPVDVARRLGADVVIGVDVKKDLKDVDYDSVINNLQLTLWFMTDGYVQQHEVEADIIITPDVKFDSYMDYQKDDYFIREGYSAGSAAITTIKKAILAKDPSFGFTPYQQTGYTNTELDKRVQEAEAAAADQPPAWSVKPIFLLTFGTYQRPGVGAAMSGGPLKYMQLGYIYRSPLPNDENSHEAILAYNRPVFGRAEAFFRRDAATSHSEWGLRYKRLLDRNTELALSMSTNGSVKWEANLDAQNLWNHEKWRLGTTFNLQANQTSTYNEAIARISPEVVWNLRENATPVLEIALAQPYVYGGVDHLIKVNGTSVAQTNLYMGTGVSFQLFGLYPTRASAGVTLHNDGTLSWRATIGLK